MAITRGDLGEVQSLFRDRDAYRSALDAISGFPQDHVYLTVGARHLPIDHDTVRNYLKTKIDRIDRQIVEFGVTP